MDPNRTLVRIREHVRVIKDEHTMPATRASHGEWLAEAIEELDMWLSNGGFKPIDWACPNTLVEAVGTELAALLAPTRNDDQVEQIQRELDAHPTWRGHP